MFFLRGIYSQSGDLSRVHVSYPQVSLIGNATVQQADTIPCSGAGDPENNYEGPKDFGEFLDDNHCKLNHALNTRRLRMWLGTEINLLAPVIVAGYTTVFTKLRRLEVVTAGTSANKEWFRSALINVINALFLNVRGKLAVVCTGEMNEETWVWLEASGQPLELVRGTTNEKN